MVGLFKKLVANRNLLKNLVVRDLKANPRCGCWGFRCRRCRWLGFVVVGDGSRDWFSGGNWLLRRFGAGAALVGHAFRTVPVA